MKILLIGGAGLLGSSLAPSLTALGHQVEICDLFVGSILYRTSKDFIIHSADATKHNEMSYILTKSKPDIIMLSAAYHPTRGTNYNQFDDCRTALDSANVLASLLSKSIKKVVFFSGNDVYGDSGRPVSEQKSIIRSANMRGLSELCAEEILTHKCTDLGIPLVVCRLFEMYGPRVMFTAYRDRVNFLIDAFLRQEQIGLAGANKKRDFIHVSDVVSAVVGIVQTDFSGIVNIGSGVGLPLITLCKEIGKHIKITNKPIATPGISSVANIELLKKILPGWKPKIKLEKHLPELIEFRKKEGQYYNVNNARQIIEDQRRT